MELKPGYKQTEIGVIPEDWDIASLDSVCDVRDGTHESPKYHSIGIPLVTSKNIVNGRIELSDVSLISEHDADMIDLRSKVDYGDLLLSMIGTVGNVAKVDIKNRFCIKNVALIKPRKVSGNYLLQLLRSDYFSRIIQSRLAGGIQKFVSLGMLRGLDIPVMPDSEQNVISLALSDIDTLITSIEKLIEKKKLIKQGVMQELLTGKRRLPGFSGEWETKRLGDFTSIQKGQQLNNKDFGELGVYPVMNGGIAPSGFTNDYNAEGNTLIISEGGNSCGFVSYMRRRFWQGGHCYSVSTKQNDMYLYYALKFKENEIMSLRVGSGLPNVQKKRLSELPVMLPIIDEQVAIAGVLNDYHLEIDLMEKRLHKQTFLKQAMMQELLTGRIRLI